MKDNFSYILRKYLRKHLRNIAAHIIIIFIFAAVFYLSNLPFSAVGYATLLSLTVIFFFILYDFYQFYKKHMILSELALNITVSLDELPDPSELIEADFHHLVTILYQQAFSTASKTDNKYQEMLDYYTLWVHQIKTPISAMRILLQTEDTAMNARLSQELFKIERYTEMVLQYLRLESMSSDLVLQYYDLASIVHHVTKKYASVFIYKKITLDIKDISQQILTDEKWLIFVIEQLISNALKYTQTGTISLYMDSHEPLTLIIEDTGIGIHAEDLPRIFERGFTGYNGRIDHKSTGLGLYLCSCIVKRLFHKIHITSVVGTGTKVYIDLYRDTSTLQ